MKLVFGALFWLLLGRHRDFSVDSLSPQEALGLLAFVVAAGSVLVSITFLWKSEDELSSALIAKTRRERCRRGVCENCGKPAQWKIVTGPIDDAAGSWRSSDQVLNQASLLEEAR